MMAGDGLIKLMEECGELLYALLSESATVENVTDEIADFLAIAGFVQEVWRLEAFRGIGHDCLETALAECIQVTAKVAAYPDSQYHPDGSELRPRLSSVINFACDGAHHRIKTMDLDLEKIQDRRLAKLQLFLRWSHEN